MLTMNLGNSRVYLQSMSGGSPDMGHIRQNYVGMFKRADLDMNGYLDKQEAPRFAGLPFRLVDRDVDERVFERELLEYVETVVAAQARVNSSRITLTITDEKRGLFDLFDSTRDGRLGLREVAGAVRFPSGLDRDGNGGITADEVPRHFQLTVGSGMSWGGPFGGFPFFPGPPPPPTQHSPGPRDRMLWFRKMDRNRDGDLSPQEFLGTQADFDRLDTDRDGLIDHQEAARASTSP
jgi:Ca2+-binding EF-hand superfamily protein